MILVYNRTVDSFASVAQWIEYRLPKPLVGGSNPSRCIFILRQNMAQHTRTLFTGDIFGRKSGWNF